MYDTVLNDNLIDAVKTESTYLVRDLMQEDLVEVVLYGSCARGDYTEDSDIDIALLTKSDRLEVKKYDEKLAAIATELIEVMTHNGAMKQFNLTFIYKGDGTFTPEDYQKVARAEQIRNASDYDDFYFASKEETRQQVENAEYLVGKVEKYIAELSVQGEE